MRRNNKYFRNLRLLLLAIMLFTNLIITSLFEYQQIKLYKQKQTENEYIILNNHANMLDQEVNDVFKYVNLLSLEPSVKKFAGNDHVDQYDKIQLYKYIKNTMPHKGFSDVTVIMYKPEYDCFISKYGIEHLADINKMYGSIPYNEQMLKKFDENELVRIPNKITENDESDYILFFAKKTIYAKENLCFLIVLNKNVIAENLEKETIRGFYINEGTNSLFKYESIADYDERTTIWKKSISVPGWEYGLQTEKLKVPFKFAVQFAIILLCLFAISSWLSEYIAEKIYKPFENFLEKYFEQSSDYDEFVMMESTFDRLIEANNELKRHHEEGEKMLKNNFLKNIFMGKIDENEIDAKKDLFALKVVGDFCCAVCVVPLFDSTDLDIINNKDYESLLEKMAEALSAEYFELSPAKNVFLYPCSKSKDAENIILGNLAYAEQKMHVSIKAIMLDRKIDTLHGMYGLYTEIIELSDIHLATIENTVYHCGSKEKRNDRYYYPMEIEDNLISFIREGNKEGFYNLLEYVLDVNATKKEMSSEEIVEFKFALMITAKRVVENFGLIEIKIDENIRERIVYSRDYEKLRDALFNFYNTVFEEIAAKSKDSQNLLFNEINDYVMNNFNKTTEMSVINLATRFNISIGYLSKLYKKMTGQKFIDYVIDIRINAAKKLLVENKLMKVKDIGEYVGYSNTSSFMRVFKKKTGVSPNEYRTNYINDGRV